MGARLDDGASRAWAGLAGLRHCAGQPRAGIGRLAICASRYHAGVVDALVQGAIDTLLHHGVDSSRLLVAEAPGALELPLLLARTGRLPGIAGMIAAGCVLRGQTAHHTQVITAVDHALATLPLALDLPITSAVLAVERIEDAWARVGGAAGHRGKEAALALLEQIDVLRTLEQEAGR